MMEYISVAFDFISNVGMTVLKSINWGEILTSVIQAILFLIIPVVLELTTGVLRNTSKYFEANKENSWFMHLMADVTTVMEAQWQIEAKDIRAKWDAGELTKEEWEKQKQDLKQGFRTKMLEKLKKYPAAYAKKFEDELDDHMEAWIAQNKRIEALTKTLQNTTVQSPAVVEALKEISGNKILPVAKKNIKILKTNKKK